MHSYIVCLILPATYIHPTTFRISDRSDDQIDLPPMFVVVER